MEGAPEVFRRGSGGSEASVTAPLYEEIGRLKMALDWLKKSSECTGGGAAGMDRTQTDAVVDRGNGVRSCNITFHWKLTVSDPRQLVFRTMLLPREKAKR